MHFFRDSFFVCFFSPYLSRNDTSRTWNGIWRDEGTYANYSYSETAFPFDYSIQVHVAIWGYDS